MKKNFIIKNGRNQMVVAKNVRLANTILERMIGLMGKEKMVDYDGLLIDPCNSIHTFFMQFSIDVIFLSDKNEVVAINRNIPPWRMTRIYFKARKVLELPGGSVSADFQKGDQLLMEETTECIN